jgi:hypothetical protein
MVTFERPLTECIQNEREVRRVHYEGVFFFRKNRQQCSETYIKLNHEMIVDVPHGVPLKAEFVGEIDEDIFDFLFA